MNNLPDAVCAQRLLQPALDIVVAFRVHDVDPGLRMLLFNYEHQPPTRHSQQARRLCAAEGYVHSAKRGFIQRASIV